MMTPVERKRLIAGSLLVVASLAIGAATGDWTPGTELDAPMLNGFDAALPTTRFIDDVRGEAERGDAGERSSREAASTPDAHAVTAEPVATPEAAEALLVLEGSASWYADALAGRRTASGEPYDPSELIAAHRALPFGTRLRVTNLSNDRSVEVRVIDRGPFIAGRILDLSRSAAEQIGMIRAGHARVRVEILEYPPTTLN